MFLFKETLVRAIAVIVWSLQRRVQSYDSKLTVGFVNFGLCQPTSRQAVSNKATEISLPHTQVKLNSRASLLSGPVDY
eukprot:576459-Amphidinium_carterae.1